MELRVLKYFLMVAREENITRAAELLHVTQPTLSRQLMQLEEELDTKLFIRGRHNVQLTDEGMMLRQRAQEIVFLEKKIEEDFSKAEELSGRIIIACGETRGVESISKIISDFHKMHPNVEFEFHTANTDTIKENIEKGIFDIGLLLEPVDISQYDFKRLEREEYWGALVKDDSPLAKLDAVKPKDLVPYPIMISNRAMVINEIANWFDEVNDEIDILANYNLGYNLTNLVRNDVGIAICLDVIAQASDLTFVPFDPPLKTNSVIVWKKNQYLSPTLKAFIDEIKKCL